MGKLLGLYFMYSTILGFHKQYRHFSKLQMASTTTDTLHATGLSLYNQVYYILVSQVTPEPQLQWGSRETRK